MTIPTAADIDRLAEWDTPSLSNALDSLRLRAFNVGYTDGSISRQTGTTAVAGIAVTARMRARDAGDDAVPVARLHAAIAAVDGPVVVVIEDADDPPGAAAFLGEVNGSLLAALGITGFVTNGRVRDVDELRGLPFPVFAQGLCVARSYMRLVEIGTPVRVAGMDVSPGDIVHGDEHGLITIPSDAIPAIFEKAEIIRADEQQIVAWSRSEKFSVEELLALRRVRH